MNGQHGIDLDVSQQLVPVKCSIIHLLQVQHLLLQPALVPA
jgi:hypothetical protein